MKIQFFSILQEIVGTSAIEIEPSENTTLRHLLNNLSNKYGVRFRNHLFKQNTQELNPNLIILYNGRRLKTEQLNNPLNNNDTLVILPAASGGC